MVEKKDDDSISSDSDDGVDDVSDISVDERLVRAEVCSTTIAPC